MGSHRAEGSAFRRQANAPTPPQPVTRVRPTKPAKPARGRRRAEPPPRGRRAHRAPASPSWARGLPQAGVVGVLGVATIVAPLAGGVLLDDSPVATASAVPGAQPQQATAVQSSFRVIPPAEQPEASEPPPSLVASHQMDAEQLAELREQAQQTTRDLERSALPGCDGHVQDLGATNGRLDTDDLCELREGGHMLRADAAVTLARLNVHYENTFGEQLCMTDSYRSYRAQVSLRANKPGLAARAGTSEHGWGLAVDLCDGVETAGERYRWLRENAPEFGWDNPDWARSGGSGPYEPWHWEYVAGPG